MMKDRNKSPSDDIFCCTQYHPGYPAVVPAVHTKHRMYLYYLYLSYSMVVGRVRSVAGISKTWLMGTPPKANCYFLLLATRTNKKQRTADT